MKRLLFWIVYWTSRFYHAIRHVINPSATYRDIERLFGTKITPRRRLPLLSIAILLLYATFFIWLAVIMITAVWSALPH
jgi:hypothetical protein